VLGGFDPVALAEKIEPLVAPWRGGVQLRRYARFRWSRHYGGNVAGDVIGCNLRCAFCWAWRFAFRAYGGVPLSPREAARRLLKEARGRRVLVARLTGGEPTIGWNHLLELVPILLASLPSAVFVVETNGILIGAGRVEPLELVRRAGRGRVFFRISIKAASPETFEKITGAAGWALDLQIKALERLAGEGLEPGRDYRPAVVIGFDLPEAMARLLERLASIDPRLPAEVEPEVITLYPHVRESLRRRGVWPRVYHEP
jgi:uncharacterized Fe-S cluster-containing radical SAM superfamily protein